MVLLEGKEDSTSASMRESAEVLTETLDSLTARFVSPPGSGFGGANPPVSSRLWRVYSSLQTSRDAPTEAQMLRLERAETELGDAVDEFNRVLGEDVARFRALTAEAGVDLLPEQGSLDIDWKGTGGQP